MVETNVDWNDYYLFLAVGRAGGLSGAAKTTGRSPATLGRRMRALERKLGLELFIRHDRGYEMTGQARRLANDLKEVEVCMERLCAKPDQNALPLVQVSAGTWTMLGLLQSLHEIMGQPADIRLRLISAENILDLPHRAVDIGFRNQRPSEEGLAGRRLSRVEFAPYGSAFAPSRWIKVMVDTPSARWVEREIGEDCAFEVTAPRNSLDLAMAGQGIALLPTFIGDKQKGLRRTGGTVAELSHDQWVVFHQDERHQPEIRRAIDRLVGLLGRSGAAPA